MMIEPIESKTEVKPRAYTLHEDKIENLHTYVESNVQKFGNGPTAWRSASVSSKNEIFGPWTQSDSLQTKSETIDEVIIAAEAGTVFNTDISTFQSNVVIADGKATGKLTKLTTGDIAQYWGEGYFIALKFSNINKEATKVMAGMDPSQGSGLVPLDKDLNGVWKITDKDTQVFKVVQYKGEEVLTTQTIDLSGLTLNLT